MAKILLIDDEPDMRQALRQILTRYGHQISDAEDAVEGLKLLQQEQPELVLLDLRLPGMDGVQILSQIRQTQQDLPVIMITGFSSAQTKKELEELGISAFLTKPFHNKDLAAAVHRTLEEKRLLREPGLIEQRLAQEIQPSTGSLARVNASGQESSSPGYRASVIIKRLFPWAVTLSIFVGVYLFFQYQPKSSLDIGLPFEHPSSVVASMDDFWFCDWLNEKIYHYKNTGKTLILERRYDLPGEHLTGLAISTDGLLFACDSWKKTITKLRAAPNIEVVERQPSPGPSPSCLFWDGQFLWSCDAITGKIYQHEPSDLSVRATFNTQAKSPVAVVVKNNTLWVADAASNKIFKHRLDSSLTIEKTYSLPPQSDPKSISGFDIDPDGYFWIVRDGSSILWKRSASRLARSSSQ